MFLSRARSIQSKSPPHHFFKIHFSITHQLLGLSDGLFPSGFPHRSLVCTYPLPHTCYMPCPSHSSWSDQPQNSWWREVCRSERSQPFFVIAQVSQSNAAYPMGFPRLPWSIQAGRRRFIQHNFQIILPFEASRGEQIPVCQVTVAPNICGS